MTQLYRALKADQMIQHELDSMTLIYQRNSGITHMVADPVPAILEVMGEDPVSLSEITARMRKAFDIDQGDDTEDIVCARLDELCELGLVERVPSDG